MKYLDCYNDDYIKEMFKKIDSRDEIYNHGLRHALNVVENIEKLGRLLEIDSEELNYLKIAGYLHDIGRYESNDNHQLFSRDFVLKHVRSKIDSNWLDRISLAIEKHHEKENVGDLSLFEHIVLFADKMDFSYKRLKYDVECFENNILSIDFEIRDNKFLVICKCKRYFSNKELEECVNYQKVLKRVKEFANKLNLHYEVNLI